MEFVRIASSEEQRFYFDSSWGIYCYSFPRCERRTLEDQIERMGDSLYHFEAAVVDGVVVGILGYWIFNDDELGNYIYLEHLATSRFMRNGGFGAKCLEHLKSSGFPILLEIEQPEDELTRRRQGFYERSGFCLNEHRHCHSPYRADEGWVTLRIMAYPKVFSMTSYESFRVSQQSIMPVFDSDTCAE